jgi:hypothetical protein
LSVEVLEERQLLATITVNTTADSTAAGSTLSLRQAIEVSNGTLPVSSLSTQEQAQVKGAIGNTNTIDFNIPTTDPGYNAATGVWTIALKSGLPAISTNAAIIDGYSQPGAAENTLAHGDNAKLKIALDGSGAGNTSGLTIAQPESQVRGLDIEKFGVNGSGILITAAGNVQVAGCFIGTDPTGTAAAPNYRGVVIENSSNVIGGPNVGDRNLISGNSDSGLYVSDEAFNPLHVEPTGNVIENNYIGTDAAGTKALGNFNFGVWDYGSGNSYGGTTAGLGNVISGNVTGGIRTGGSVTIEGNYLGTDVTGNVALGGGYIYAEQDLSGSPVLSTVIKNNVVSGNGAYGISVNPSSQPSQATYLIANNLIGTNAAGTAALGNGIDGLLVSADNASILDNVISGNGGVGLRLGQGKSDVVQGNLIGTDKTGQVALGNTAGGIVLSNSTGALIGGTAPGQGNVIANNGGSGIEVDEGQQNRITHNSIYGNTGVGISLGPFVSQAVPAPVLAFTPGAGSTGTLSGTLKALPGVAYTIEIYSNPSALAAGQEQGKAFVQDVTVNTDGSGKGTFSVTEPIGFYSATAIDPSGNTSPFSNAVGSQALAATQTAVSSSSNPSTVGQPVTFTAVVTAPAYQGTPTGTVTFYIDGHAQSSVQLSVVGGIDEAQFTTSTLSAGSHTVTAVYSGDAHVSGSSGPLPTQAVTGQGLQTTTTTLASSVNPSTVGQGVTFTAIVAAPGYHGTPTGTVTFTIDGRAESSVPLSVVGGVVEAQFVTSALGAGQHSIAAAYSGDSSLASSAVASPLVEFVREHSTTITVVSSANPSGAGQPVTFTATVKPAAGGGALTGSVTFTVDGKAQTPVPLERTKLGEQATFRISTLSAGKHTVTATYSGDASDSTSSLATPLVQTVMDSPGSMPRVTRVERFGFHMHQTVLVVSFSMGLDPASATNPSNYVLVDPSGRRIGFRSVSYDSSAHTVTLRPRELVNLHHNYRFAIKGSGAHGVASAAHTLLDGAGDGQPGTDFVMTLNWRELVLPPSVALKLHRQHEHQPSRARLTPFSRTMPFSR